MNELAFGMPARPAFTCDDGNRAFDDWGCNCGPGALAAMTGLSLDAVRSHMGDFERKGYTNPSLMLEALRSIGVPFENKFVGKRTAGFTCTFVGWPVHGLARIQWEGPWTKPGVPMRARYRHTHWVGAAHTGPRDVGIFDINCMNNGSGWVSVENWKELVVPAILEACVPKASGLWHITHAIEIDRASVRRAA